MRSPGGTRFYGSKQITIMSQSFMECQRVESMESNVERKFHIECYKDLFLQFLPTTWESHVSFRPVAIEAAS